MTAPKRKLPRKGDPAYAARTISRDLDETGDPVDDVAEYLRGCDLTTEDDVRRVVEGGLRSVGWEYVS